MPPPADRVSLLLADVDGTLVTTDKVLRPAVVAAVARLRDAGIAIAVTSSRPPRGLAMLVEPLGLTTPLGAFNGGLMVGPDLAPLDEALARPPKVALEAADLVEAHGIPLWLFAGNDWLLRSPEGPLVAHEIHTIGYGPIVVDGFAPALSGAAKIVGASLDYDRVAACEAALRQALGGRAFVARSQPYYVDVTHVQATKARVVEFLSARLGIPAGEIATIGDAENDVPMFAAGGLSIAMGNAAPAVQAQAHFVTGSNEADGFAAAVERLVLPRAP